MITHTCEIDDVPYLDEDVVAKVTGTLQFNSRGPDDGDRIVIKEVLYNGRNILDKLTPEALESLERAFLDDYETMYPDDFDDDEDTDDLVDEEEKE